MFPKIVGFPPKWMVYSHSGSKPYEEMDEHRGVWFNTQLGLEDGEFISPIPWTHPQGTLILTEGDSAKVTSTAISKWGQGFHPTKKKITPKKS